MSRRWIPGPRFMLDHRFAVAHVSDYLDGELEAPARARVERHASICPKCHELIHKLRRTLSALGGLRADRRPERAERVIERLQGDP